MSVLSVTARALLVELTAMYWGPASNGRLFLSVRDAAHRLGLADTKAASAAIDELLAIGLLKVALPGHFASVGGKSKARAFWLSWKDEDGGPASSEALPDLDFGKLSPKQKRRVADRSRAISAHRKGKSSVGDSATLNAVRANLATDSVVNSSTVRAGNHGNLQTRLREDFPTHVYYQGGAGARCPICLTLFTPGEVGKRFCSTQCQTAEETQRAANDGASGWWASINPIIEKMGRAEFRAAA